MEYGSGYGAVFLVLYGGYTLILLAVLGLGVWLLKRGHRWVGGAVIAGLVAWCFGPPLVDYAASIPERRAIDAAQMPPEALSFEGRRVLVIEAGSTICAELCGDLVQLGVPGEFYWLDMGGYTGGGDVPNPDFGILDGNSDILRVRLGAPIEDGEGMRFAEPVEDAEIPPFDVVLIDDDGYLRSYAPHLLGLPDGLLERTQVARVMIEGWPDPYVGAPPEPTYRTLLTWQDQRVPVYWPFSNDNGAYPAWETFGAPWAAAMCDAAGREDARDAFTYAYLCDQSRLGEVMGDG